MYSILEFLIISILSSATPAIQDGVDALTRGPDVSFVRREPAPVIEPSGPEVALAYAKLISAKPERMTVTYHPAKAKVGEVLLEVKDSVQELTCFYSVNVDTLVPSNSKCAYTGSDFRKMKETYL